MAYGDKPKWVAKAATAIQTQMLSRLSAGAALLEQLVSLSAAHAKHLASEMEAGRDALGLFLPPKPEPVEIVGTRGSVSENARASELADTLPRVPKKARRCKARLYAPQMLVLGQRAIEMMATLAPVIRDLAHSLLEQGIDIRPYMRTRGALHELGIDLADLEYSSLEELQAALDKISAWIEEAKESNEPPRESMPRAEPEPKPEIPKAPEKSNAQLSAEMNSDLEQRSGQT